jgi:hypothetical protein
MQIVKAAKLVHRSWQRGDGYARNIFEPATAHQEIDYLHANPVRRRLCPTATDDTWSSAADWAGLRNGPCQSTESRCHWLVSSVIA